MTVLAKDDFNRANGGLGSNWTTDKGSWTISSNTAVPGTFSANDAQAHWSALTWPPDQYSNASPTVTGTTAGDAGMGVCVRESLNTSINMYALVIDHAASGNVGMFKNTGTGGTYTHLATGTSSFTDGDNLQFEAKGTTLTGKVTAVTVSGLSITDSSLASGRAGIYFSTAETSASIDNWEGGDFSLDPALHGQQNAAANAVADMALVGF